MSVVSSAAEVELVTASLAREWCRARSVDDAFLAGLIPAARQAIEAYTGRALVEKILVDRRDCFPCHRVITLEQPPLQEVTSISYVDSDGEDQTLSDELYTVDIYSAPGRIVLNELESWPSTKSVPNAVTITYVAGYDHISTGDYRLPESLRDAMRFLIAHWFSNREPYMSGGGIAEIPETLMPLFFPWKVNW